MRYAKPALFLSGFIILLLAVGVLVLLYATVQLQQRLTARSEVQYTPAQLYTQAQAQIADGQFVPAENYLKQALQKQDDNSYHNQLAVVEYRLKKYPESIAEYHKLIDAHQDEAFAWNGIGNAQRDWAEQDPTRAADHRDRAVEAYQKSYATNDQYVAAYSNLAILYQSEGKRDQAIASATLGIAKTKQPELVELLAHLQSGS